MYPCIHLFVMLIFGLFRWLSLFDAFHCSANKYSIFFLTNSLVIVCLIFIMNFRNMFEENQKNKNKLYPLMIIIMDSTAARL